MTRQRLVREALGVRNEPLEIFGSNDFHEMAAPGSEHVIGETFEFGRACKG